MERTLRWNAVERDELHDRGSLGEARMAQMAYGTVPVDFQDLEVNARHD